MKRFLLALALVALTLPASAFRDPICFQDVQGLPKEVTAADPLPVDVSASIASFDNLRVVATGQVNVGNFPATQPITGSVVNPGIATATLYTGSLATDAVTLISDIVTLASNDIVEMQVSATSWRGPSDVASATLQGGGIKMQTDDSFTYRYDGADFALIADPAAVSTYRMIVYKDR